MSGHGGDAKKPGTPSAGTPKHKPSTSFKKAGGGKADLSKVPRDENGSILMLEDEVEAAFKFLDVKQTGKVTLLGLKQRFGVFYNSLPVQRIKNMMDGRHNFTLEMMKELVIDNGINDFDPVAEAFKVYDRENLGCLSSNALRDLFAEADITELDEEDLQILVESCDLDKDGQVGLEDFRMLGQVAAGGAQALLKNKKAQRRGLNKTNTMRNGTTMSMSGRTQRVSFHQTLKNISALADGDFRILTKPNFLESLEMAGETRLNEVVRKEVLSDPVILRELLRMTVANKFNARRVTHSQRPQRPHSAHPQSKPPPAKTTGRLAEGGDTQTMQQTLRPMVTIRNAHTVMPDGRRDSHAGGGPAVDESGGVIGSLNIEDSGKIDNLEHLLEASLNKQHGGHRGTIAPPPHRGSNAGSGQRPKTGSMDSLSDSMKLLELLGSTDHIPSEGAQGGRRRSSFASSSNGRRRSSASNRGLDMTQSAEDIELLREAGETMALLELLEDKDAGAMGSSQGDDFMDSTAKLMSGAR